MLKQVKKLIIPASGWGTQFLPMTKIIHKELAPILNKPTISYLVEEPFAIILSDDLIKSKITPIKQLINLYQKTNSSVLGVQNIALDQVNKYGIVKPKNESEKENTSFEIKGAIEKPNLKDAPITKAIIGRYVFAYSIVKYLDKNKANKNDKFNIVDAFKFLLKEENIYALEIIGKKYDLGSIDGFVKANIDFALKNKEISSSIKKFIKDKNL